MNYDLDDGRDILNRILIIHDYQKHCRQLTKQYPDRTGEIAMNFIDFISGYIVNDEEFSYNNQNAPGAAIGNNSLHMKSINYTASRVLRNIWELFLIDLNIKKPKLWIRQKSKIPFGILVQMTKYPDFYFQYKDQTFLMVPFEILDEHLDDYFNDTVLTKLINPNLNTNSSTIVNHNDPQTDEDDDHFDPDNFNDDEIQSQPTNSLNYHFESTRDFLDRQNQDDRNRKESGHAH